MNKLELMVRFVATIFGKTVLKVLTIENKRLSEKISDA